LEPFDEMSLLQNQMNRLFDTALQGWPGDSNGTTQWTPAADIYEAENELVVNLDLPGVDPKMVDIRVETTSSRFGASGNSKISRIKRTSIAWSVPMAHSRVHSLFLPPSMRTRFAPTTNPAS
jgi:hypothetical protein